MRKTAAKPSDCGFIRVLCTRVNNCGYWHGTTCHDWPRLQSSARVSVQSSSREWESVGIQLKPLGNAVYVACLSLLCRVSKWLNGESVWLVFRRSWVRIPVRSRFFFSMDLFLTLSAKSITIFISTYLSLTVNNIKPLKSQLVSRLDGEGWGWCNGREVKCEGGMRDSGGGVRMMDGWWKGGHSWGMGGVRDGGGRVTVVEEEGWGSGGGGGGGQGPRAVEER